MAHIDFRMVRIVLSAGFFFDHKQNILFTFGILLCNFLCTFIIDSRLCLERRQDPLDKLLTMGWQDLLLPVFTSGSLMLICFYIGHYQFSLLWVLLLTALYLLKTRLWVARQEARLQVCLIYLKFNIAFTKQIDK